MRTAKEVEADLVVAQAKLDEALNGYHLARKSVIAAEDIAIGCRETLRILKEELETTAFNEVTIDEVSSRDKEISEFRERVAGVMERLEKNGTAVLVEPISAWISANKDLARQHAGCYVALAFYKGILVSHKDKDTFSIRLANLDPSMRQIAHVFEMDVYLKIVDGGLKDKIGNWISINRKQLLASQSFREAAQIIAKGLGNKTPSDDELTYIEGVLGASRAA
jgi:hypothetical protein